MVYSYLVRNYYLIRTYMQSLKFPEAQLLPFLRQAVVVWWWTFLHNLPWPQALLALLEAADSRFVAFLDMAQQRIEWVSNT